MNDDSTLTALRGHLHEVRDSLGDVHMTVPASAIFAGAKKRRRRRVAAAGAACAALGLALALVLAPGGQARQVHVHLTAWSVDTNPDGTVTFKLRDASQPARLQHALAEAGVPAMVRWGEICLAQGQHVLLPTEGFVRQAGVRTYVNGRPAQLSSAAGWATHGQHVTRSLGQQATKLTSIKRAPTRAAHMLFDPTGRYLLPLRYDNQPTGPDPVRSGRSSRRPYLPGTVVKRLSGFRAPERDWLLAARFTAVTSFSEDAQPLTADHKPMVIVVGLP